MLTFLWIFGCSKPIKSLNGRNSFKNDWKRIGEEFLEQRWVVDPYRTCNNSDMLCQTEFGRKTGS